MKERKKRWPESEVELAAAVVEWLRFEQWEVYQEVQLSYGDAIADIVAVREPVVWVIETKRSLSLEAIRQAEDWHYHSHLASVAIPVPRSTRRLAGERICRLLGVGLLMVQPASEWHGAHATEAVGSRFHRKALVKGLRGSLHEGHKTFAPAGNANGRRWSPWRETCDRFAKVVASRPGIGLKEAIESIDHHYASEASARSSMSLWLREGKIDGVRCENDGRRLRLFPVKENE